MCSHLLLSSGLNQGSLGLEAPVRLPISSYYHHSVSYYRPNILLSIHITVCLLPSLASRLSTLSPPPSRHQCKTWLAYFVLPPTASLPPSLLEVSS